MKNSGIQNITPLDKNISFIIHINNMCNFRCDYCIAGQEFSNDILPFEKFVTITDTIQTIVDRNPGFSISVDLTGGEPTLHERFVDMIDILLKIDTLSFQISTNGLLLTRFDQQFNNENILKNTHKFRFNMSYHFTEYKGKTDTFIKSIGILQKYRFNFRLKFLLPDKNETLENFLIIQNTIIEKTGIKKEQYKYYMILDTNGKVSESYSKEMLDFYFKDDTELDSDKDIENNSEEISNCEVDSKSIMVEFENGQSQKYGLEEFKSQGLNKFKGYECSYISDQHIYMNISTKGEVVFGPCFTLYNLKYQIKDIQDLILSGKKSVICPENTCVSGISLPKKKSKKYESIKKLEKILEDTITVGLNDFEITNIGITLNKSIKITLKIDNFFIYYYIEVQDGDRYIISKNGIGYYLCIRNENNIVIPINDFKEGLKVKTGLVRLTKFDNIYNLLLLNNEI